MEQFILFSLALSVSIALIGTVMISGMEKSNKVMKGFLSPKTRLTKKRIYLTTMISYLYFGIGCFIQLYKQFL